MSKSRPVPRSPEIAPEPAPPAATGPVRAWVRFWFTAADPLGLHVTRLLAGLVLLAWLLPLAGHVEELFGLAGGFDRQAYREAVRLPEGPPRPITWSVLYLCGANAGLLKAAYWLSIAVLVLFTAGMWTRVTAVLAWVVVASFTASPAFAADADALLLILAFYLMVGYVLLGLGDRDRPLFARLLGARSTFLLGLAPAETERRNVAANVAVRLLQVHFALVVFVSGLHKLQSGDWWAGYALWYPLHPVLGMKPGSVGSPEEVRSSLTTLSLAAYAVLAWQLAFPFFAWRRRGRLVLLGGAAIGWLGSALLYQVPTLGPALCVGCLSFVSADEWYRLFALAGKLPGLHALARRLPAPPRLTVGAKQENAASSVA